YFYQHSMVLRDHPAFDQPLLGCFGIGSHQTSGSQKGAPKVSGYYHCCIVKLFSQEHIQYGFSRSSPWFSVITEPHDFPPFIYDIGKTVMGSVPVDRKSTRLNSSHVSISYAVFC